MSENTITSVAHFVTRIEEIKTEQVKQSNKSDFLFRGQPCDRPLRPKLWRVTPKGKNTTTQKLERLLFEKFNRDGVPFHEFEPKDDWDRLALAQHHGLPTRLLDWTFSAPAALWFAVRSPPQHRDGTGLENGAVWVLRAPTEDFRLDTNKHQPFDDNSRAALIFRPKAISPRIVAQSAAFTVHRPVGKELVPLENHPRYKSKLLKLIVPTSAFRDIRKALHMFNANEKMLFPDLDGLSRHLEWRHTKREDET